jgi:serine/threonine protein kinase/CheY-like chemotaxis protein
MLTSSDTSKADVILVVDDEAQVRRLLAKILEMDRYVVIEADNGETAMEILRKEEISLVLADLIMPTLGGMQLLQAVRQRSPQVPVIIISGKNDVEDAVQCIRTGAADYIAKPFKVTQIRQAVKTALKRTQTMRRQEALSAITRIAPQESLAGYEIVDTLGEGTMGTVLLAEQVVDGVRRKFAIKVLKVVSLDRRKQAIVVERFMREAKTLAALSHPNIVKFVEYGLAYDQTVPYFVMEYVEGKSLRHYIRGEEQMNLIQKVHVLRDLASALEAIHSQNICHRDIKPDNIIITPDMRAVLTDFGVVRVPESDLTLTSQFVGSPAYLSPEGYRYGRVDSRSDIFSLGVVAYELLLGRKPFIGENIAELSRRVLTAHPVAPIRLQPDFPIDLQQMIALMLRKDPELRYASTAVLVRDLDAFLQTWQPPEDGVPGPTVIEEPLDSDWQ